MSQATQDLWARNRARTDPLGTLRDVGSVDISTTVRVNAAMDEVQTATITLTLSLDDASHLAGYLDKHEFDGWDETVTELRKALGLAGCWVELQEGP